MMEENRSLGVSTAGTNKILNNIVEEQGNGLTNVPSCSHRNVIEEIKKMKAESLATHENPSQGESKAKVEERKCVSKLSMQERLRMKQQQSIKTTALSCSMNLELDEKCSGQEVQSKVCIGNTNNSNTSVVTAESSQLQLKEEKDSVANESKPVVAWTQQKLPVDEVSQLSKEVSKLTTHADDDSKSVKSTFSMAERLKKKRTVPESQISTKIIPKTFSSVETVEDKKQNENTDEHASLKIQANFISKKNPEVELCNRSKEVSTARHDDRATIMNKSAEPISHMAERLKKTRSLQASQQLPKISPVISSKVKNIQEEYPNKNDGNNIPLEIPSNSITQNNSGIDLLKFSKEVSQLPSHKDTDTTFNKSAKPNSFITEQLEKRRTESTQLPKNFPIVSSNTETVQNKTEDMNTGEFAPPGIQANLIHQTNTGEPVKLSKDISQFPSNTGTETKHDTSVKPSSSMAERLGKRRSETESQQSSKIVLPVSSKLEAVQNKKEDKITREKTKNIQVNFCLPQQVTLPSVGVSSPRNIVCNKPSSSPKENSININDKRGKSITQGESSSFSAQSHVQNNLSSHQTPPVKNIHANVPSNETLTHIKNIYLHSLASTVASVTIQDLLKKQWNFLQFEAEAQLDASKLVKSKDSEEVKRSLEPLSTFVWELLFDKIVIPLETKFQESTCFWENELDSILQSFAPNFPPDFPPELISILQDKIQNFNINTKERNLAIRNMEKSAIQTIMNEANLYFKNESICALGSDHLDNESLCQLTDKKRSETLSNFETALKVSSGFNPIFCQQLNNQLSSKDCQIEIIQKNQMNKKKIEDYFNREIKKCLEAYKGKLEDFCRRQRLRRHGFWLEDDIKREFCSIESQQRKISLDAFDKLNTNNIKSKEILIGFRNQLVSTMDTVKDEHLNQLLNLVQQKLIEEKRRKQREAQLEEERKLREESELKRKNATKKTQHNESHNHELQNQGSKSIFPLPPTSLMITSVDSEGLKSLPKATLAFHVGLNRTKVGVADYKGFQTLDNVSNVLYYSENSLNLAPWRSNDSKPNLKSIPIKALLMKNPVDKTYEIKINGKSQLFRLEALLAILFNDLKIKAQLQLRKEFNRALFVVPQSLNRVQRMAVRDAGKLAGFREVNLINDTTAMAFALMVTENPATPQFLTVNCFEGFIDAGIFSQQNGHLKCEKMLGDYILLPDESNFLKKALVSLTSNLNPFSSFASSPTVDVSDSASNITPKNIKQVLGSLKDGENLRSIIACQLENFKKLQRLDCVPNVENKESDYALLGAALIVSMENHPSIHTKKYLSWRGYDWQNSESGVTAGESLELINDGSTTKGSVNLEKNPQRGTNLNLKKFEEIKKTNLYVQMKLEEEACIHLLKLAFNLEIKLFNSSDGPQKKKAEEKLQSYYNNWEKRIRIPMDEICELQDIIKQLENEFQQHS